VATKKSKSSSSSRRTRKPRQNVSSAVKTTSVAPSGESSGMTSDVMDLIRELAKSKRETIQAKDQIIQAKDQIIQILMARSSDV
jgi:hypothetical protein